jgi:AcrR family transcriptional regulator
LSGSYSGFAGISHDATRDARVGDIAKEAGVAYGLVYHYFTDRRGQQTFAALERIVQRVSHRLSARPPARRRGRGREAELSVVALFTSLQPSP